MVDLKANPYYLSDEDCKWVEETIASMTPEEKVGQLFFQLTSSQEEEYLKELMEKYHLGECRYNPMPERKCRSRTVFCRNMRKFRYLSHVIPKQAETEPARTERRSERA